MYICKYLSHRTRQQRFNKECNYSKHGKWKYLLGNDSLTTTDVSKNECQFELVSLKILLWNFFSLYPKVRSWECFFYDPPTGFSCPRQCCPAHQKHHYLWVECVERHKLCSQRLLLTRVMVSGWLKSLPPESRNPQGAGPSSTTFCGISVLFRLSSFSKRTCRFLLLARENRIISSCSGRKAHPTEIGSQCLSLNPF